MIAKSNSVAIVRWLARVLAIVLFFFWGAFFIEHLWAWFIRPLPETPPLKIWLAQLLHLLILVGLLAGIKSEREGSTLVIVASVLFLWDKAPLFILPTILPGMMCLFCWYQERRSTNHSAAAG
jgi:hypothetical protein